MTGTTIAETAGTMPNKGAPAQTLTTQGDKYNIPAGYFSGGSVKAQFANLIADNIKKGVNIGGVVGNLIPAQIATGTVTSSSTVKAFRTYIDYMDGYTLVNRPYAQITRDFLFIPSTVILIRRTSGNYSVIDTLILPVG